MGRLVSRMQRDREDADYSTGAVFTDEKAAQMIADAEAFLARPVGSLARTRSRDDPCTTKTRTWRLRHGARQLSA
jgi:hypothetical protein